MLTIYINDRGRSELAEILYELASRVRKEGLPAERVTLTDRAGLAVGEVYDTQGSPGGQVAVAVKGGLG